MKRLKMFITMAVAMVTLGSTIMAGDIIRNNSGSSWRGSVFGDVGGTGAINSDNFKIVEDAGGSVDMSVSGNRGKIAGGSDGILYYYQELDPTDNFELSATIDIKSYTSNSQVSFGLMVRDEVLVNVSDSKMNGDYIAAGPLGLSREAEYTFNRKNGKLSREGVFTVNPMPGTTLNVKVKKSGDTYELTVGGEDPVVIDNFDFNGKRLYAGLYVVRNTSVTFEDIKLLVADKKAKELLVVAPERREYLPGQGIDLTGMIVTAVYEDGSREELTRGEYIISGFDTSEVGETEIIVNHNGARQGVKVDVVPLSISKLNVNFFPVKTDYFMWDAFDSLGMEVEADYNNGYLHRDLEEGDYFIYIEDTLVDEENPFVFDRSGKYQVTLVSAENPEVKTEIGVRVSDASLKRIDVAVLPETTQYFLGDELDLNGMVAYAVYSDGSRVRLGRDDYTVSGFSSRRRGDKRIEVAHKDKAGEFTVNIKKRADCPLVFGHYNDISKLSLN